MQYSWDHEKGDGLCNIAGTMGSAPLFQVDMWHWKYSPLDSIDVCKHMYIEGIQCSIQNTFGIESRCSVQYIYDIESTEFCPIYMCHRKYSGLASIAVIMASTVNNQYNGDYGNSNVLSSSACNSFFPIAS